MAVMNFHCMRFLKACPAEMSRLVATIINQSIESGE